MNSETSQSALDPVAGGAELQQPQTPPASSDSDSLSEAFQRVCAAKSSAPITVSRSRQASRSSAR